MDVTRARNREIVLSAYAYFYLRILSDNGAWTDKGLAGGSNGLLRGQKGETWEGGMRYRFQFLEYL